MISEKHISVIGGAGHVGLPLGLAFAQKNFKVHLIDKNTKFLNQIKSGKMPFLEVKADSILKKILKKNNFYFETDLKKISQSKYVIICIGTPVNRRLKPNLLSFFSLIRNLKKYVKKNQIIIIRSSLYPGTINKIKKIIYPKNSNFVYCPERIVQSKSLIELPKLPQIIAAEKDINFYETKKIFKKITNKIIKTNILEAEIIKLYSNANRYINFAIANQLYSLCDKHNLDFYKVRNIMQDGYKRNLNLAKAGFTSGPCLLKDTMQLYSFCNKQFELGLAAMKVNEKIPQLIIKKIKNYKNYKKKTIGILGLTFKGETDDIRDSLSIKLLNELKKLKLNTLQSDEYYQNEKNVTKNKLVIKSDIIVIGAPHKAYTNIKFPKNKFIIDIWKTI